MNDATPTPDDQTSGPAISDLLIVDDDVDIAELLAEVFVGSQWLGVASLRSRLDGKEHCLCEPEDSGVRFVLDDCRYYERSSDIHVVSAPSGQQEALRGGGPTG